MDITIWHNPACGTSRNTLAMLRAAGHEPRIVEYLKSVPSRAELAAVAAAIGGVRALLRAKGAIYEDLGLADPAVHDETILDAMLAQPVLIERPVVIAAHGIVLARPSEKVLALIGPLAGDFVKEDGERVPGGRG